MAAQPGLFDLPPALPEGLRVHPDILSATEEADLISLLAELPFAPFQFRGFEGRRRVTSFGWRYDFERSRLDPGPPLPEFLFPLRARAAVLLGAEPEQLAHALVTEYAPGAAIGWHKDRPELGAVIGVSRRGPEETPGLTWDRPPLQEPRVEILRSIEHNRLPAALGTSTPPSGISGAVRRFAFRYSESRWAHWLLLMLADRINVVEGLVEDLRGGHAPNLWAETGMPAEVRSDRKGLATAALVGVGVIAAVVLVSRVQDRD